MRIDEVFSRQVVQESKQSNASQSAKGDDAFELLLQNEIAKPQEQTVEDDSVCQSESLSAVWGPQPLIPASEQPSEASQSVSALNGVLTQLDSLQNALREAKSPK